MAGYGTGSPNWFMCPKLRAIYHRDRQEWHYRYHGQVQRTGRTKPRKHDGRQGVRTLDTCHEYQCGCGHVGWTTHVDIVRYPLRQST